MSENNLIRDTADAVKGIAEAVPIYQDAVQPAAREVGKALETVAKTINLALLPVTALVWGGDAIRDVLLPRLAEKLKGVPPERIETPKPNIVGPALEALRYTGHDPTLRELYANLLASSLDRATALKAHPAFVDIIRNLSPDEARIMRLFSARSSMPMIEVVASEPDGLKPLLANLSTIGEDAGCEHERLTPSYLDNLERLGLVRLPGQYGTGGVGLKESGVYDRLEKHEQVEEMRKKYATLNKAHCIRIHRQLAEITSLGWQFCDACVLDHDIAASE